MRFRELLLSERINSAAGQEQLDLELQAVLEELVNERRREMILTLEKQPGLTAKELADVILATERDRPGSVPDHHSVYTSVKQNHIPRFVQAELVVSADEPITLTDRGESMAAIIRLLDSRTTEEGHS